MRGEGRGRNLLPRFSRNRLFLPLPLPESVEERKINVSKRGAACGGPGRRRRVRGCPLRLATHNGEEEGGGEVAGISRRLPPPPHMPLPSAEEETGGKREHALSPLLFSRAVILASRSHAQHNSQVSSLSLTHTHTLLNTPPFPKAVQSTRRCCFFPPPPSPSWSERKKSSSLGHSQAKK